MDICQDHRTMDGAFRICKTVAAPLLLACIAITGRYIHSYIFRNVETPDYIVINQDLFRQRTSQSQQRSVNSDNAVWKLAVVTNRQYRASAGSPAARLPSHPGSLLEQARELSLSNPPSAFGHCEVTVPLLRNRGTCELKSGTPNAIQVAKMEIQARDSFLKTLCSSSKSGGAQDILVFVHGYNVELNQAIARAAQVAEDIPFHGRVVVFSWQSQGDTRAYRADEASAERYFWNLSKLLYDLKSTQPESRLHVLAHSMGNRVTLRAISALCGSIDPMGRRHLFATSSLAKASTWKDGPQFQPVVTPTPTEIRDRYPEWGSWHNRPGFEPMIENLIMAAPDVDASRFENSVSRLKHTCGNLILYASDTDFALEGSRIVNGQEYRAGDSRAELVIDGLQTIRVTGVDANDRLGHSFYGSRPTILNQLEFLLNPSEELMPSLP